MTESGLAQWRIEGGAWKRARGEAGGGGGEVMSCLSVWVQASSAGTGRHQVARRVWDLCWM